VSSGNIEKKNEYELPTVLVTDMFVFTLVPNVKREAVVTLYTCHHAVCRLIIVFWLPDNVCPATLSGL